MNMQAIPNKLINISEFKIPNLKIRRFFILINGSRTLAELMALCHISECECENIIRKLIEEGSIEVESLENEIKEQNDYLNQAIECKGFVDCLIKELTLYIGPVAKIIVEKTDAVKNTLSITQMNQIVEEVSKEIDNSSDRLIFIETMTDRIAAKKG
jgi:butyrate kinase